MSKDSVLTLDCEAYQSIDDMPILKWYKLHQTRELKFLLIKPQELNEEKTIFLRKIWSQLSEEFIDRFGFSRSFLAILEKKRQRAIYQLNIIITGDKSDQTWIDILTEEIDAMEKANGGSDIHETKTTLERYLKFRIDLNLCSVSEFQYYIKSIANK